MSSLHPVKQLNAEVARKIAAGEVIDRPNAIIRELMDNAIDSQADKITVEINGGGIDKIRIVDNGYGMTKDDLQNCAKPHATSKIQTEVDLLKLSTLGFRGEALSSIAAVCRLSIVSGGYKMRASITEDHIIEQTTPLEGTIVQAEGLFENFPARRVFLKRPSSEATMCKNTFVEKSLPFPNTAFRFSSEGIIKLDLPANQTLIERFVKAMEFKESSSLFYQIEKTSDSKQIPDWSFKIIIGEPGVFRNNKKDIYIFVNGRRITEYSLTQAIEYGGQGFFPNGSFPVAAAFIQVNPELVDFNIHPAKKEARFKDISELHHAISTSVKNFFSDYTNKTMKNFSNSQKTDYSSMKLFSTDDLVEQALEPSKKDPFFSSNSFTSRYSISHAQNKIIPIVSKLSETIESFDTFEKKQNINQKEIENTEKITFIDNVIKAYNSNTEETKNENFHFLGSALGTFLIAEKDNTLYIIDKHAAHERYLFDKIMKNQSRKQILLIPYIIETKDESEDYYLESIKDELSKIGFDCSNKGNGKWEFTTLQERWKGSEIELEHDILDKKVAPKDLIYSMAAITACKAAVKDGWILDDNAAKEIVGNALTLEDPHCPHGRPVYTTLTREQLFGLVRRT